MVSVSSAPYTQLQHLSVNLGQEQLELITKPALPDWELYSPSTELFLEHAAIKPDDCILLYGCHTGLLAVSLAHHYPHAPIFITDDLHTSLEMSRFTLEANHVDSVATLTDIAIPRDLENTINTIFIQIPKGRSLAQRWLLQAQLALVNGGKLYLAGANKAGIHSVINDGRELFGNGSVLGYKKGNRIAFFTKISQTIPEVEWAKKPGIAPGTWYEFMANIDDKEYKICSLPGVFSYDHLDDGTRMLLGALEIPSGSNVLDVGCGYGMIGLYAGRHGASNIDLTDNNLLATASCAATLDLNGVSNARVFTGDLLDPVSKNEYDLVLSNPPFHAGYKVDFQIAEALIDQAQHALHSGGKLIIVANRFIRYDYIIKAIFGNVTLVNQSGKFHVLSGVKSR